MTAVAAQFPGIVQQMTESLKKYIESGRSTPGPQQSNDDGQKWWSLLPWDKK
jgi:hypothetical protein